MAKWNVSGKQLIDKFAGDLQFDALIAFEDEAIRMAGSVILDTPIGLENPGKLRNNWQIARKPNNRVLKSANKRKSGNFAEKRLRGKFATVSRLGIKKASDKSMFLFNNSPYARVVEFGGYPSPVKKGTYNKRTKKFEVRSTGGFSKQAPRGMLRLNVIRMKNRLRRRMKKL